MSIQIVCTSCSTTLNVPDVALGKRIKCLKCQAILKVPAPVVVETPSDLNFDNDRSEDEDQPPVKKKKAKREESDDEEEQPVKKKKAKREESDDDEDEDERPRKKSGKKSKKKSAKSGNNKTLLFVIAGVVGIAVIGGIAALLLGGGGGKKDGAKKNENNTNPTGNNQTVTTSPTTTQQLKGIDPIKRFTVKAPLSFIDNKPMDAEQIYFAGDKIIVSFSGETQIWEYSSEPKLLHTIKASTGGISDDQTLIYAGGNYEIATGMKTETKYIGSTYYEPIRLTLTTPTEHFFWRRNDSAKGDKPFQLRISENPSVQATETIDISAEDRVDLAPVLSGGKEFMFGIAPQNKVAVFDFATRKIVKEITLANPRVYRGGATPGYATYTGFRVSSDGKWIATRRRYESSPPYEIFNRNGDFIGAIENKDCSDYNSFFLNGRDYFIGVYTHVEFARAMIAYDIGKKELVVRFQGAKAYIRATGQSSDGKMIASCDKDGEVCIWSTAELK